jgi:hypothetical protein
VTTSTFADTARAYGKENRIELIDGNQLVGMMLGAYPPHKHRDVYRPMCLVCGLTVTFCVSGQEETTRCAKGHAVTRNLPATLAGLVSECHAHDERSKPDSWEEFLEGGCDGL